jgi:hypothetical protein
MAAGLLNYDQPDPLTLGLLGFSQAISAPRSRGGGVAAALSAFPAGQMQAADMRRRMEADELRKQLAQAQIGKYQFDMDTSRAAAESAQGEQQRIAELGQWIQTNRPDLFPAFRLDPKSVASQLLPKQPGRVTVKQGEAVYEEGKYDKPLVVGPDKPAAQSDISRLISERAQYPQGSAEYNLLSERILALNYRQPASTMSVSYGAPFEGVGPDGQPMLFQASNRGGPPVPTGIAPPARPQPPDTKKADATEALSLIEQARTLLPQSTASYSGVVADTAMQAVGAGTKGAQAAAQLKALEGALIFKMPKMTGPQSDRDVLLYRQMAGQIGDATVPASVRLAALNTIEDIQRRYAGLPPRGQATPASANPAQTAPAAAQTAPAPSAPAASKPKSKIFKLDDGSSVNATLDADGNYYVKRGNKRFLVEE